MATQIGLLRITGMVCGICFYRMKGVYYARQKSSLSGKRVKKDPAFTGTMRNAGLLGKAAKIASERYQLTVPKAERSRSKYREMVGVVMRELVRDETINKKDDIGRRWTQKNTDGLLRFACNDEPRIARIFTNKVEGTRTIQKNAHGLLCFACND